MRTVATRCPPRRKKLNPPPGSWGDVTSRCPLSSKWARSFPVRRLTFAMTGSASAMCPKLWLSMHDDDVRADVTSPSSWRPPICDRARRGSARAMSASHSESDRKPSMRYMGGSARSVRTPGYDAQRRNLACSSGTAKSSAIDMRHGSVHRVIASRSVLSSLALMRAPLPLCAAVGCCCSPCLFASRIARCCDDADDGASGCGCGCLEGADLAGSGAPHPLGRVP
eukprot:6395085-Prymnesium_polylepis.1